ncbi:hypothetical protein ABH968_004891 [Lysinibacillus sp. RC79]
MPKRKLGNRSERQPVIERKYSHSYLDISEFKGYILISQYFLNLLFLC